MADEEGDDYDDDYDFDDYDGFETQTPTAALTWGQMGAVPKSHKEQERGCMARKADLPAAEPDYDGFETQAPTAALTWGQMGAVPKSHKEQEHGCAAQKADLLAAEPAEVATAANTAATSCAPAAAIQSSDLTEEERLHTRLAAAQQATAALPERRRQLIEAIAAEKTALSDAKRKVTATYERLSDVLEIPSAEVRTSDPELVDLVDDIDMLKERLRMARLVLQQKQAQIDAEQQRVSLIERFGALAPPSAPVFPSGGGSTADAERRPTGPSKLNEKQMSEMMQRLVPSKQALANKPGLHPNSAKLFKEQGVDAAPPPPPPPPAGAAPPRKGVDVQNFIERMYEGPRRKAEARAEAYEERRQAEASEDVRRVPPLKKKVANEMLRRLHEAATAKHRERQEQERDRQAPASAQMLRPLSAARPRKPDAHGAAPSKRMGEGWCEQKGSRRDTSNQHAANAPEATVALLPEGERFELTVPEGYASGDDLPVELPDGRRVLVTVPAQLTAGQVFVALIPT